MSTISKIRLENIDHNIRDNNKLSFSANQGLTDAQKLNARVNMGALSVTDLTPYSTLTPFYGKIFYIDSTASGATYTFYDSNENVITPTIGSSPAYYTISGTPTKEKYYSFNDSVISDTYGHWTFCDGSCTSFVDIDVGTATTFGSGKNNTDLLFNEWTSGRYAGDMWVLVDELRYDYNNSNFFIGSQAELEILRTATDGNGNKLTTVFDNYYIWSSSELPNYRETNAYLWDNYGSGNWVGGNKHYKYNTVICFSI